ncbi:MAG: ABC transporter ATP-binding protein [Actinobacteria bacterium]|nr:ABC transporter ATP-binding protein [Actinomycetota bacterium]
MSAVLEVAELSTAILTATGARPVVRGVSFAVAAGETLAIVGESGSGKTLTALSVMGLLPDGARVTGGSVRLGDRDLLGLGARERRAVRGAELAMIYQDPTTALNPLMRVGAQVRETLRAHGRSAEAARGRTLEALDEVGLPNPERIARAFPHQLSGGMRQRVVIAIAVSTRPRLLIADEPTTALDVTVQQQILALVDRLRADHGMGVIWITHDLGVVARIAQRTLVMYAGRAVEVGRTADLYRAPQHPYTAGLLGSVPPARGTQRPPLAQIGGQPPDPGALPPGCPFRPRCPQARDRCAATEPPLLARPPQQAACWVPVPEWSRAC